MKMKARSPRLARLWNSRRLLRTQSTGAFEVDEVPRGDWVNWLSNTVKDLDQARLLRSQRTLAPIHGSACDAYLESGALRKCWQVLQRSASAATAGKCCNVVESTSIQPGIAEPPLGIAKLVIAEPATLLLALYCPSMEQRW